MRTASWLPLAIAGGLGAGCLSAPTGVAPSDAGPDATVLTWPPPGVAIDAIAAGDVDGDGADDLIAVDATAGTIYLLRGGAGHDVDPGRADVVSYTRAGSLPGLRAPVAVAIAAYQSQRHVVVLDSPTAGTRLTLLDRDLVRTGGGTAPVPVAGATGQVSLTVSGFGISMASVFGTSPGGAFFIEGSALDDASPQLPSVPATGGTAFADVLVATGYLKNGTSPTPRIVVSERTLAQRSDAAGGAFAFQSIRSGAAWSAQAIADITGDSLPDVVGYDANGANPANLCVLDVDGGATPTCLATPFGMDGAQLAVGPMVQPGKRDLALLDTAPGRSASLIVLPDLHVATGAVQAGQPSEPAPLSFTDARMALAQLDSGVLEVLVVGRGGAVACLRAATPMPLACH